MRKRLILFIFFLTLTLWLPGMSGKAIAETADFDGNCTVELGDFLAFQNAFASGDMTADLDADGELAFFDFLIFQNAFEIHGQGPVEGCGSGGMPITIPVLQPGSGFDGETEQPAPIGAPDDRGHNAKAIARWNVVPFQTFDDVFEIGIPAFHVNGIDRVEFSVDGGPWVAVEDMTPNPRTKTEEYTVALDASAFSEDGPVEVRAIIYPKAAGVPRVLAGGGDVAMYDDGPEPGDKIWTGEHSLWLNVNVTGDNSEVVLELPPGEYTWDALPGALRSTQVPAGKFYVIRGSGTGTVISNSNREAYSGQPKLIRLENLKLKQIDGSFGLLKGSTNNMLWFNNIEYEGLGMWERAIPVKLNHSWWTDVYVHDAQYGMISHFVRGAKAKNIGEDTTKSAYMLLNVHADRNGAPPAGSPAERWHGSFVSANSQYYDNRLYYGIEINAIGKHFAMRHGTQFDADGPWKHNDVALVNVRAEKTTEGNQLAYLGGQVSHLYVKDSCFNGSFGIRLSDSLSNPLWRFKLVDPVGAPVLFENIDFSGDSIPDWEDPDSTAASSTDPYIRAQLDAIEVIYADDAMIAANPCLVDRLPTD